MHHDPSDLGLLILIHIRMGRGGGGEVVQP